MLLAFASGCAPAGPSPFAEASDSIASAPIGAPPGVGRTSTAVPRSWRARGFPWIPHFRLHWRTPREKLDGALAHWSVDSAGTKRVEVLIRYGEPVPTPRLPDATPAWSSHDLRALRLSLASDSLLHALRAARAQRYAADSAVLVARFGARILQTYQIAQMIRADIRLDSLVTLAARGDVRAIRLANVGGPPPDCGGDYIRPETGYPAAQDAGKLIGLPGLRGLGFAHGPLALLDTGVDGEHKMLLDALGNDPGTGAKSLRLFDCERPATGVSDEPLTPCSGSDNGDVQINQQGHGTETAALLVGSGDHMQGTAALKQRLGGVTDANVDEYRVFTRSDASSCPGAKFNSDAYTDALSRIEANRDPVALFEIAEAGYPDDLLCGPLENAFHSGVAAIVAVGNSSTQALGSPGCARGAIACGTVYADTPGEVYEGESRMVVDSRLKPDLQAAGFVQSASLHSHSSRGYFTSTSSSAPFAAAAALELRNWMASMAPATASAVTIDPGQVYAALIACGSESRPSGSGPWDVGKGAGLLALPDAGRGWWGATDVGSDGEQDLSITVSDPALRKFSVGIWWLDPEALSILGTNLTATVHHDVDLGVEGPGGQPSATSSGTDSVFERVHLECTSNASGTWTINIKGRNVGLGTQHVYWAMIATP